MSTVTALTALFSTICVVKLAPTEFDPLGGSLSSHDKQWRSCEPKTVWKMDGEYAPATDTNNNDEPTPAERQLNLWYRWREQQQRRQHQQQRNQQWHVVRLESAETGGAKAHRQ